MKVFINESILASNKYWEPRDKEEFESNILTLISALYSFQFFNESEIYFNSVGIDSLLEELAVIDEVNEYSLFNVVEQLRQRVIDLGAIDWSQNVAHRADYNYLVQLGGGFTPYPVNGTSLAEAAEYKYNGYKTVVLNFSASDHNTYGVIKITRTNTNPPQDMTLQNIDSICTKKEAINYYLSNRIAIGYSHNPKHGENHTRIIKKKGEIISPLECTQVQAMKFVKVTIGGEKSTDLFAYDEPRGRYIRFKHDSIDNANNTIMYHGFYPHDQKILQEIKDFLFENRDVFNAFANAIP